MWSTWWRRMRPTRSSASSSSTTWSTHTGTDAAALTRATATAPRHHDTMAPWHRGPATRWISASPRTRTSWPSAARASSTRWTGPGPATCYYLLRAGSTTYAMICSALSRSLAPCRHGHGKDIDLASIKQVVTATLHLPPPAGNLDPNSFPPCSDVCSTRAVRRARGTSFSGTSAASTRSSSCRSGPSCSSHLPFPSPHPSRFFRRTRPRPRQMCVLAGCDYLGNLERVGPWCHAACRRHAMRGGVETCLPMTL